MPTTYTWGPRPRGDCQIGRRQNDIAHVSAPAEAHPRRLFGNEVPEVLLLPAFVAMRLYTLKHDGQFPGDCGFAHSQSEIKCTQTVRTKKLLDLIWWRTMTDHHCQDFRDKIRSVTDSPGRVALCSSRR